MNAPVPAPALAGPMPFRARAILRLLRRLESGSLAVTLPDGQVLAWAAARPGPAASIALHRWRALRRLAFGGGVGFAEAYIDGDWSSPDVASVVELSARNATLDAGILGSRVALLARRAFHALRANTRTGSRRNIVAHYDLGNAFYARWLDAGMTYSSALYERADQSLEEAQQAKQDRALALLDAPPGARVLEIGCGWGGLVERMAARGHRVTGITLSPSQLAHARARPGADSASLRLQDWRDVSGIFDRIVSIEMLEAVGEAFWPAFFARLHALLVPGGVAVLQVITIDAARFAAYRRDPDFIQRHIFPGGMLPTIPILERESTAAGLVFAGAEAFDASYARTLAEWRRRFLAAWPDLAGGRFDEAFRRKWEYYLAYCEGGFRAGALGVGLYRLVRPN